MEGGGEEEENGRKKNVRREEVWGERNGREEEQGIMVEVAVKPGLVLTGQ